MNSYKVPRDLIIKGWWEIHPCKLTKGNCWNCCLILCICILFFDIFTLLKLFFIQYKMITKIYIPGTCTCSSLFMMEVHCKHDCTIVIQFLTFSYVPHLIALIKININIILLVKAGRKMYILPYCAYMSFFKGCKNPFGLPYTCIHTYVCCVDSP